MTVETVVCLSNTNLKPKDYVEIGVDAEDYYRIKHSEKKSKSSNSIFPSSVQEEFYEL